MRNVFVQWKSIAIIAELEQIYKDSHEPEAIGINKFLMKPNIFVAHLPLDFVLLQVSKLRKCLQTEKLDLYVISSLFDATLHTLDDVLLPAANWVLELQHIQDQMKSSLSLSYRYKDIMKFQNEITRPFYFC